MNLTTFAVCPEIDGDCFTSNDLIAIGLVVGEDVKIELNTSHQMIVKMDKDKAEAAKQELRNFGLCVHDTGSEVINQ